MGELGAVLPFIGIALLFWLLIIRPASKRQKALSRMQSELAVGDEVMLTSGILGSVDALEDSAVRVRVADGVVVRVVRGAIGSIVPPAADEPTTSSDRDPSGDATEES